MPERWRRELAAVDRASPDYERIRARAETPSRFPSGHSPARSRIAAGVTAIVVFALAVSTFVIPMARNSDDEPPQSSQPQLSFLPFVLGAPKTDAVAEARRMVALTQVPPGSQARDRSPVRALNYPPGGTISCSTDPCPYAIDVPAWWTMPLSRDEAISWLQTHPPAGLYLNGNGGTGGDTAVSWTYQAGPAPPYSLAELSVAVASFGADKSVLRVDGQVLWVPPRTAAEQVPEDVQQVSLVQYRGDRVVARKRLDGAAARELADLLNRLRRINMGPPTCPFDSSKATHYTMTFPHSDGPFVFTEWGGCSGGQTVFVEVAGHEQPPLLDETMMSTGSIIASMSTISNFLECRLSEDPYPGCRSLGDPSSSPAPDPLEVFCGDLHQLRDWFASDVAGANGDEEAAAEAVRGQLGGVMMWFNPDEQAITDATVRAAADEIVTDSLALQTWTTASGKSFTELLDTFDVHSEAFVSRYCS
jgi:hypothetical protein